LGTKVGESVVVVEEVELGIMVEDINFSGQGMELSIYPKRFCPSRYEANKYCQSI